nr:hypothetical protein [Tanacetum cinerariifolium]
MARLQFCDYHNMVAILEKGEFNTDFHPMVDFIAASPLRYALTVKPTIFVSHIRQFWSTARIETTNEGTHNLATVDGIQRTVSEASLRRHLKLRDEDGIVSIPDTELFENLTLMGIKTTEDGTQILATLDGVLRTVTESSLRRNLKLQDEEGISSLPDTELFENLALMGYNSSPNQKFTFQKDTEEMETVLTTMDAATVLASGTAEVPTSSGSIPTAGPSADEVPIASPVFATATVVTPYRRRKGKEVLESAKKQKISEEVPEEVKSSIEVPEEKIKEMMQLVPIEEVYMEALQVKHSIIDWRFHTEGQRAYWKITRLEGSSASYQFFTDLLKHLDRDDLNQLWSLVKETLSKRPATSDK